MTTKQRKSGSATRRTRKRSSSANGSKRSKGGDAHDVGTVIKLAKEDAATIRRATEPINALYEQLGRETERHRQTEAQLSKALADAAAEQRSVMLTVAGKYGVDTKDPSQMWNIDESQSKLTRVR